MWCTDKSSVVCQQEFTNSETRTLNLERISTYPVNRKFISSLALQPE